MKIKYCTKFIDRFMGLMFKKQITPLCFPKCNSIHTFFMLKPIDIIMTDKNNKVIYIYRNLKPFRIIFPKKNVYFTYEFPINHTYTKKVYINDIFI